MRRRGKLSVLLVGLVAGLLLQAAAVSAGTNKPVKVNVNCPKKVGDKFTITVDPFEIEVAAGEGVEWKLDTDNSKNEDIRVSAKDEDDWLYVDVTAKGKKTVVMTEMIEGASGNTYDYTITVYCGDKDPVVLDPRIRVGGG